MKRTLIVVDCQNDFITGPLGTPEAQAIVPKVREKFLEFYDNNENIIFTRDTHFENYLDTAEGQKLPVVHCIENTDGWEISSDILTAHEEDKITDIIDKKTFGFDSWGVYDDIFEECDEIVVVGVCTDNLSESYGGYSTRWGDGVGDFAPLANLTSEEVVAIGDALGLPYDLVHKTPADGLCGKTDEDNFGFTYAVLNKYIRTGVCEDEEIKRLIDEKHEKNLFKLQPIPSFKPNIYE